MCSPDQKSLIEHDDAIFHITFSEPCYEYPITIDSYSRMGPSDATGWCKYTVQHLLMMEIVLVFQVA